MHVVSENSFPTAAGLASSASGYACLTKALAALMSCAEAVELSDVARMGAELAPVHLTPDAVFFLAQSDRLATVFYGAGEFLPNRVTWQRLAPREWGCGVHRHCFFFFQRRSLRTPCALLPR